MYLYLKWFIMFINKLTIWLLNIAMENPPIFKNGKPSISMDHLYHGYVSHNQRVQLGGYRRNVFPLPTSCISATWDPRRTTGGIGREGAGGACGHHLRGVKSMPKCVLGWGSYPSYYGEFSIWNCTSKV